MNVTRFLATTVLGFSLVGAANAMEESACEVPSVDGFGAVLDGCVGLAQASAAQPRKVNISPVEVDFGAVKVGAQVKVPVTFTNLTNQPQALAGGGIASGGAFSGSGGTCSGSVPANGSCSFMYYFRPSAPAQTFTGQTGVTVGPDYQALKFRGSGTESLAQVTPVTIDFGDALLGQMLKVPVTLRNTHDTALTLYGGGIGGGAFGNGPGSTCSGSPIAAGASCFLNYSFTPSAVGATTGSTGIGLGDGLGMYMQPGLTFKGNGIATAPQVSVYPRSVDFGSVKIGRTTSVPVTIANHTSVTLTPSGGGFNNNAGGAFGATTGCAGSVAPGQSCAFTYYFQPRLDETVSATTSIGVVGSGVPYQNFALSFSGTGIGTLALVTPPTIAFGRVRTGTSMSVPVTITNTSESPLTGFIGGAVPSPFSSSNACPASLAVGANCTITYTFNASVTKLGAQSADTVLSFTNTTGVRPSIAIHLDAFSEDPDKIFFNGFD